ncbi:uncharacterized protein LOC106063550 [Biomphalaria glabrata]|uniref:Uncharacterized protein LOC106063550 n=1 Tax=Biomphalaria glabrata TaxID=6526 RepID=A0A9W3B3F9_BIOGL|nr:uncharacterized protein LOC106063550 [Biomphalaria glabrata]
MMSDLITAESLKGRIFTCLYLYKMTSTKFLMYQGPTEEKGLPYYDYVKVALVPKNLTADQLCDLDESAFPPSRHNLLIRNDSLDSSKTTCPAELLGHYRELSCNTTVDVCSDRKQMIFDTKDCNLETFYFAGNVTLLCLTSLSLGETTYVTVYRDDDNAEGYWNSSFLCMAVTINDTTVYIRPTPRDCRGLDTPAQDAADLVLETLG